MRDSRLSVHYSPRTMNLAGSYDVIRYHCSQCAAGVIEAVVVSPTRIGLTGFCAACNKRETAWFDLLDVERFNRGGPVPKIVSTAVCGNDNPHGEDTVTVLERFVSWGDAVDADRQVSDKRGAASVGRAASAGNDSSEKPMKPVSTVGF